MKTTYCNPLDLGYRYQHMKEGPRTAGFREGADPTLVYFKGKYYLFVSMSAGFWYSEDLLNWTEYYIINRPMMEKRTPIHTCIRTTLKVVGSVRKMN